MNIKEAIERGLYPKDEKGRALVPMRGGGVFTVAACDKPATAYAEENGNKRRFIVGWSNKGIVDTHTEDSPSLLPPPPRKVKVTGWAILGSGGNVLEIRSIQPDRLAVAPRNIVELTGEYEEPWS